MSGILVFRPLGFLFLLCVANLFIHPVEGTNTPTPEPPTPPPELHFAPGLDVSLDRFFTFDPALLAAPPGFAGGNCTIPPISLIPDGTVTIILPPPIPDNCTDSLESINAKALNVSLPYLLEQMGVPHKRIPALVAKAAPIFENAVKESLCFGGPAGNLSSRGIFDDLVDLAEDVGGALVDVAGDVVEVVVGGVEDVGEAVVDGVKDVGNAILGGVKGILTDVSCSFFAAGALPLYLTAAGLLVVQNVGKPHRATTPDQDFFIFPLHGPISHNDGIRVIYNANFPPTFEGQAGVTMGRNIYVRSRANTINSSNPGFPLATKLLLHEFTHSKQYQKLGYNLPAFGSQYLFNYCKGGLGRPLNNKMEVEARAQEEREVPFLVTSSRTPGIGMEFLRIWKAKNLRATLGLPTSFSARRVGGFFSIFRPIQTFTLQMQRGIMSIRCPRIGPCT